SGIGPRLALAAINELGADGLRLAVANEDLTELSRIPGVGKKTAQRMALEIGDKLGSTSASQRAASTSRHDAGMRESVEAGLEQLGYPRAVAQRAVDALEGEYADISSMIRDALAVARDGRLGV
ncbi:MAG: Holliday junction branch migration protein RuvA, partial [Scrofimicrobium sp.]